MAGGTDDGGDGFDWMYGDRPPARKDDPTRATQRPRAGSDDPEPTMMLPTQSRTGGNGPSSRGLPPAGADRTRYGATPEPPRPSRQRGRSGWRSPRRWVRIIGALIVLWLVYTIAVPFFTWTKISKVPYEPSGHRPADQPGTTYLMVGSDSRAGLTRKQEREYHTGRNHSESLADTIMILHTGSGPDTLVSFPRDWIVNGAKINSYYRTNDATHLVKALEQQTGIRIDDYVQVGLGGVAGVVDAVGGIRICPKERMNDHYSGLHVHKGCQQVGGATALAYARARHDQRLGDLDRVHHQREVIAQIGKKVFSPWSVLNPIRWWRLNQAVPAFFSFGDGTSKLAVARWALAMRHANGKDGKSCTMPVTSPSANDMDTTRARPLFKAIIEDRTQDITKKECTASGLPQ
ncbi:MAG: LCP family protein [Nocardioidaceae bacterium]|nr:LCP family protein [Nocardioidaceae bacterium]MCL2614392.1 LCP family protein [Nocardioidaceae bacterium]